MEGGSSTTPDRQAHASKGAGSSASCQAQSSQGAQDQVVMTKRVCLVGKFPLVELNPQSWQEYKMDPDKKAAVINWLNSSILSLDIPVEDQEIIKVHRMLF